MHNALYSHQIDIANESEDSEKLFYIYQHFQDSEKIHQIGTDSDVLTMQEDSLYPYVNNDIEYGLFEDIVESYHLDSQITEMTFNVTQTVIHKLANRQKMITSIYVHMTTNT